MEFIEVENESLCTSASNGRGMLTYSQSIEDTAALELTLRHGTGDCLLSTVLT